MTATSRLARLPIVRAALTASTSPSSPSGPSVRGSYPIAVRHRDVRRYASALSAGGAAPTTVARKLAAIRGLFNFLLRSERAAQNPADLVSSPKRKQKLPSVLSVEQLRELLWRIPARTPLELRDRAMFELAYSCGLRCEEVIELDVDSVDLRERAAAGSRQGLQGTPAADRRTRSAGATRYAAKGREASSASGPRGRSFSRRVAGASPIPMSLGGWASGSARRGFRPGYRPMRCATASPRISWKEGPICARSRSSSATPRSRRPRSTPASMPRACARPTPPLILVPEARNQGATVELRERAWKRA